MNNTIITLTLICATLGLHAGQTPIESRVTIAGIVYNQEIATERVDNIFKTRINLRTAEASPIKVGAVACELPVTEGSSATMSDLKVEIPFANKMIAEHLFKQVQDLSLKQNVSTLKVIASKPRFPELDPIYAEHYTNTTGLDFSSQKAIRLRKDLDAKTKPADDIDKEITDLFRSHCYRPDDFQQEVDTVYCNLPTDRQKREKIEQEEKNVKWSVIFVPMLPTITKKKHHTGKD